MARMHSRKKGKSGSHKPVKKIQRSWIIYQSKEVEKLVFNKLPTENMIYVGNLDLNPGERDFFNNKKIKNIDRSELLKNKRNVIKDFKKFVSSFKYLHVTFDIDFLNKIQAPATGIPSENGPMVEDIEELLDIIRKHPNLSFDLTEVNPQKAGIKKTIQSAHKVLLKSLKPL